MRVGGGVGRMWLPRQVRKARSGMPMAHDHRGPCGRWHGRARVLAATTSATSPSATTSKAIDVEDERGGPSLACGNMKELVDAVEVEDGHRGAGSFKGTTWAATTKPRGWFSWHRGGERERGALIVIIYACHEVFEV